MVASVPLVRPMVRRGAHAKLKWTGWLLFLPFAVAFAATVILPLGYAVGLSLFRSQFIGGVQFAGLANYAAALTDPALYAGLGRVMLFMLIQIPVILVLALGVSMALDSGRLAFASVFRLGIFIPYAIPTVVAALMWGYMYGDQFGLIAQAADALNVPAPNLLSPELIIPAMANISVWQFTGYNMLIFYAALQSIPRELYEAAAIDGAGQFRIAWSIKLPALVPAILLAAFFSAIGGIQLFTEPSILQSLAPTTIVSDYTPAMYMYNLAVKGSRYEYSAAIAVTLGVATILLVLLAQIVVAPTGTEGNVTATMVPNGNVKDIATTPTARARSPKLSGAHASTLLTAVMILALAYYLVPLVWLVISSTKTQSELFSTPGLSFGSVFALWENIEHLFAYQDGVYGWWLLNTAVYAIASALGSAVLCSMGGYALAHFDFPGKRAVFAIIVGAVMVPGSVLALPIFLLISQLGLTDTALAVVLPSVASPFALYLMTIFASQSVPRELIEAARVDGAGELRIFGSIALRLMSPGLVTVTLFQLTAMWNAYFLPLIVLNDDHKFPLGFGLAQLNARATQTDSAVAVEGIYPMVMVGSVIAIIPLVIAFLVLQRYWRAGLATGAVKL